jgi:putative methyltransferase (TIGR04325 family)
VKAKDFHIWEGRFSDFKEAPRKGPGFSGDLWVDNLQSKAKEFRSRLNKDGKIPGSIGYRTTLLPVVVSTLDSPGKKVILDFGGGLGIAYMHLLATLEDKNNIEYHIVENSNVCSVGRKMFGRDPRIRFHLSLPAGLKRVDVAYVCSALQYIEDWEGLLRQLTGYRPGYFLLEDLAAGAIKTFASSQNYYGSKIPYWFLDMDELTRIMQSENYGLIFRSAFFASVFGKSQELPMRSFPKKYRLGHACNLLFRRV